MNLKKIIWGSCFLSLFLMNSCLGNRTETIRQVKDPRKIYGNKLVLPQNGMWSTEGSSVAAIPHSGKMIVHYINSEGCTSCKLKELHTWKPVLKDLELWKENNKKEVRIIFILESRPDDENVKEVLKETGLQYPVLFDLSGEFKKKNVLPGNDLYHTFLVDNKSRIILAGSPVFNPRLLDSYKELILRLPDV